MRPVTNDFLLNMAEVSSALIGLFLVGMFFFAETGFRRLGRERSRVVAYFRSSTRIVLILFAIPLGLSLSLVALDLVWSRVLFAVLSLVLLAANVDTLRRIRGSRPNLALIANELFGTAVVVLLVVLPWALGGLRPTREDLTWAILLAFAAGFTSIGAAVVSVFDVAESRDPVE